MLFFLFNYFILIHLENVTVSFYSCSVDNLSNLLIIIVSDLNVSCIMYIERFLNLICSKFLVINYDFRYIFLINLLKLFLTFLLNLYLIVLAKMILVIFLLFYIVCSIKSTFCVNSIGLRALTFVSFQCSLVGVFLSGAVTTKNIVDIIFFLFPLVICISIYKICTYVVYSVRVINDHAYVTVCYLMYKISSYLIILTFIFDTSLKTLLIENSLSDNYFKEIVLKILMFYPDQLLYPSTLIV